MSQAVSLNALFVEQENLIVSRMRLGSNYSRSALLVVRRTICESCPVVF
jgi:hypothetical protein